MYVLEFVKTLKKKEYVLFESHKTRRIVFVVACREVLQDSKNRLYSR